MHNYNLKEQIPLIISQCFSDRRVFFAETYSRQKYLEMGRGYAWLDTGTYASLLDASNSVRTLTERQGLQVGSPDEVAYISEWITKEQISILSKKFGKNSYLNYLR